LLPLNIAVFRAQSDPGASPVCWERAAQAAGCPWRGAAGSCRLGLAARQRGGSGPPARPCRCLIAGGTGPALQRPCGDPREGALPRTLGPALLGGVWRAQSSVLRTGRGPCPCASQPIPGGQRVVGTWPGHGWRGGGTHLSEPNSI